MQTILLLLIVLLVGESYAVKQTPFDSADIRQKRADLLIKTIYDQFVIVFDEICLSQKQEHHQKDVIQEFLNEFKCYLPNQQIFDEYRGIGNHWIVVNRQKNCNNDDKKTISFNDYCIMEIYEDEMVELHSLDYQCSTRSVEDALWNLNYLNPEIMDGFEFIQYNPSFISSIDLIVMDSGIDATHSEFNGITISRIYDAYPDQTELAPHGTHITGTMLGTNYGVFRAAYTQFNVYDVRILPTTGGTPRSITLNGYSAIISHLQGSGKRAVINMSFGGFLLQPLDELLLQQIADNGGISVASAGNDNIDAEIRSPASSNVTIAVGALNEDITKASFSNFGHFVDIWAPGVNIKSAFPNERIVIGSGTSVASPLVAGVVANILALNSDLEFDDIKAALLNEAIYDVDDENGLINEPRVQASCSLYTQPNTTIPSIMLRERVRPCDIDCARCRFWSQCEFSALGCIVADFMCKPLQPQFVDPIVGEATCNGPTLTGSTEGTPYGAVFYTLAISNTAPSTTVTLSTCGSTLDTVIFLYDENLNLIKSQDYATECGQQAHMIVPDIQNGNYIIRVDGRGSRVGNYSLTVTCDPQIIPNCIDQSKCFRSEITPIPCRDCPEHCLFKICIIYDPSKPECIKNVIDPIDHICTPSGGPTKICKGYDDNQEFCCKDCVENPFAPSHLCEDTGIGNSDTCGGIIQCQVVTPNQYFIFGVKDGYGGCTDIVEDSLGNELNLDWECKSGGDDGNICAGGNKEECQWSMKIPESYCISTNK